MKIQILTGVLVLSIILVTWIELEIFPFIPTTIDNPEKFNSIVVNFSLAYISSYFFYYLVVYLKEQKDRKNSIDYVLSNCLRVIGIAKSFKDKIEEIGQIKFSPKMTKDELNKVLAKVKLDDEVANHRRLYKLTWENYLKEISTETRYPIDRILGLIPYLDSDLVKILNKIYDSNFLSLSTKIAPSTMLNTLAIPINMTMYSSLIEEYFNHLDELQGYIDKNLKKQ